MPLCPQITITPITVTSSGMTQSSVIAAGAPATTEQLTTVSGDATAALAAAAAATAAAAAAVATANAAQSTASSALANAATAYTAAIGSLQPSADTIVNASNQMTAISSNGITVYSGASATSGARVVMNSTGLAGYNSSNAATFSITASTGAAVFSGSVTGATITASTMNIGGNAIIDSSGYLTATGATITGAVTATSGTFTGTVYASAGSFTGAVTATSGTFTGTVYASAGSFTGAVTATSGSFTGSIFASSGTIGGSTLSASTITGGTIQTSSGAAAVILDGSSNAVTFKTSSTVVGHIVPLSTFGILTHYGATADPTGGTFPQMYVGSANVSMFANTSNGIGISTTGISLNAVGQSIDLNNKTNYPGVATGSGTAMVLVTTGSRIAIVTSSERFKEQIKYTNSTGWLDKVMQMKPITYKTSEDFTTAGEPNETQVGFLAEDIYDLGGDFEKAVVLDPLGEPFSLSYERLTVFLTLAIKELKAQIDQLKGA